MDIDEINSSSPCRVCREQIKNDANKCIHCGSFQDWRRYVNFSNTVLALLVALASVMSWGIPTIKEAFKEDKSEIVFGLQNVSNEGIIMLVSNIGTKAGGLSDASLDIDFNIEEIRDDNKFEVTPSSKTKLRLYASSMGDVVDSLSEVVSYSLRVSSSGEELTIASPYLKPGEVGQYIYKFSDSIGRWGMALTTGDDIKNYVSHKSTENHEEQEFKAFFPIEYLFDEELKKFFRKSKCTLKFSAINYNGEKTKHIINNSCDLIFPYLSDKYDIRNPYRHPIKKMR